MTERIVVDTSALLAVAFGEHDADRYVDALDRSSGAIAIAAPTYVESVIVTESRRGDEGLRDLHLIVAETAAEIIAFDAGGAELAMAAWRRFGKGRHPAGLNLGDCFSYALAKQLRAPLLYKGDDFAQTDVANALDAT